MALHPNYEVRSFERFGQVAVWKGHDDLMGHGIIQKNGQIIPNMPKLHYALDFEVVGGELDQDSFSLSRDLWGARARATVKRDGFNLLFWRFGNEIVAKTRLYPEAGEKVRGLVASLPDDLMERVGYCLDAGYSPVFEIWGTDLVGLGIHHGGTVVEEISLKADLIAMKDSSNRLVDHTRLVGLAAGFGLDLVEQVGDEFDLTLEKTLASMEHLEFLNNEAGRVVHEGLVLHAWTSGRYLGMYKVKPFSVMEHDVLASRGGVMEARLGHELEKMLMETSLDEMRGDPDHWFGDLLAYVLEDQALSEADVSRARVWFEDRLNQ